MKSMREYTDAATTVLLEENGAFFAFGSKQYAEQAKTGVDYVTMGMGLVGPRANAQAILEGFGAITRAGIALDLAENGTKDIIWREFANFECQIVGDPADAIAALEGYGILETELQREWALYWAHCVKNDYF